MDRLSVQSFGPIEQGDITFGDLTILVGPQASGKSLFLQLLKLIVDKKHIKQTLEKNGYVYGKDADDVLQHYFGEGMQGVWSEVTGVFFDKKEIGKQELVLRKSRSVTEAHESIFYIPAQRIITLQNGWPRNFTNYAKSDPYILKQFSETLRNELEYGQNSSSTKDDAKQVFPRASRLSQPLRNAITDSIFYAGKVVIDEKDATRLKLEIDGASIPFMTWSAGQKEFMPLLLSFYHLLPSSKASTKSDVSAIVLEEPEMGLHPQATKSILLEVLELLKRGYKVIISTHSPVLLEFIWAIKFMQKVGANSKELYKLFGIEVKAPALTALFKEGVAKKEFKTYYFNRRIDGVYVEDISELGINDDVTSESWGGLSEFASNAVDLVTSLAAKHG